MAALVSSQTKDSDKIVPFFCTMCVNTNTEADSFFCDECLNQHSQLFQSHTAYGPEELEKWPVSMATQEFLEKCEVHNGKKLKLFCKDHSKLCCDTCVQLNHRQCLKVTSIADPSLSATEYHQQLSFKEINYVFLGQLLKLQTNWESNMKSLQESFEERLKEMRSKRERINAILDKLEKATLKDMDEVKASWNASLKFDVDACSKLHTELTRLSDAIQEIGKKNKELAFIACQKSTEMFKEVDKYLDNNSTQTEVSLKLIDNNDIEHYLSNLSGLGHTIHIRKELTMLGSPDQAITMTGATSVSVRIPSDTSNFCINGICGLFNGQIVVADCSNEKLKLLDLQHKVVSYCDMPDSSSDMCLITPCQVAVAVDTYVQFFSVNSGQLVKDRELQLQHECRGVAHHQGDLYVTSVTALYKYTLTGTLVNKMYEDTSALCTDTVYKCAVSPSGDRIYVTNYSQNLKLLTLARNGTPISTFTDTELKSPRGVHVTPRGQVLVCGYMSKTVIQVDREGKKKIATLAAQKDGIKNPRSVFYNWKSGSVIVGQYNNENILVFNLK